MLAKNLYTITAVIGSCINGRRPPMVNYQGKLTKADGTPLPDGTYGMTFAIYDVPAGGLPLWWETNTAVQVKKGLFGVLLGSVRPFAPDSFTSEARWFGVKVGEDPEMAPRQQLAAVPFAFKAALADSVTAGAITAGMLAPGVGTPAGAIIQYGGAAAPEGWLLCDGRAISRTLYPALFTALGATYGPGDGAATFNLPNLQGKVPVGKSAEAEFDTLGKTGGEKTHVLTVAEMPTHSHSVTDPGHTHKDPTTSGAAGEYEVAPTSSVGYDYWGSANTSMETTGISLQSTGNGQAHNNLQPYVVVNYLVKW